MSSNKYKIFFAHSTHGKNDINNNSHVYNKLSEYFEDERNQLGNIEIIDFDKLNNNNFELLEIMKNHIDDAHLFICDITPDYIIDESSKQVICENFDKIPIDKIYCVQNQNVSVELGYAIATFGNKNIILIQDEAYYKKTQSLLCGIKIKHYNSSINDFHLDIVEEIKNFKQNDETNNQSFKNYYDYMLNEKSCVILANLLENKILPNEINNYVRIVYSNNFKKLYLKNKNNSWKCIMINIKTKKLEINYNKQIDLCYYAELYEDIKHLEILLEFELLK